jgi:hypothetical protein
MAKLRRQVLVLLMCGWTTASLATDLAAAAFNSDSEWLLRRESADIKIFTRNMASSDLNAVRIETVLPAELGRVVALLTEVARRPEWDEMCKTVTVLSTADDQQVAYYHYDMPWPVADRDIVLQTEVHRTADAVVILSNAVANDYAPKPERVRVSEAWYRWHLSALSPAQTAVVAEMFMDPAGPIPAWLLNRLALTQPSQTIERLRHVLDTEKSKTNE